MRWTDVPAQPAARPVVAWQDDLRRQDIGDPGTLAAIVQRVLAVPPDADPVVALQSGAMDSAWQHVRASRLERGGLLLGEVFCAGANDTRPVLVYVRAAVPSRDSDATRLSLRMGATVWDAARELLQPGEVVVGWYHSHPGIGAFFSDTDRRTQAAFFNQAFSLGWVIDPQRAEQAWFVGPQARALPRDAITVVVTPHARSCRR